jgi:Novel STAND NTPase 1
VGRLHAAEEVRTSKLTSDEAASLESILVRLINLGETAGATRRIASIREFTKDKRVFAEKLSTEKYGRLLIATDTSVELCHEQLISQWPWWQSRLTADASDVRRLGRLSLKAQEWASHGRRMRHLSTVAELRLFKSLRSTRRSWLSTVEVSYINASSGRIMLSRIGTTFLGFVVSLPLTVFGIFVVGVTWSLLVRSQEISPSEKQVEVKKDRISGYSEEQDRRCKLVLDIGTSSAEIAHSTYPTVADNGKSIQRLASESFRSCQKARYYATEYDEKMPDWVVPDK